MTSAIYLPNSTTSSAVKENPLQSLGRASMVRAARSLPQLTLVKGRSRRRKGLQTGRGGGGRTGRGRATQMERGRGRRDIATSLHPQWVSGMLHSVPQEHGVSFSLTTGSICCPVVAPPLQKTRALHIIFHMLGVCIASFPGCMGMRLGVDNKPTLASPQQSPVTCHSSSTILVRCMYIMSSSCRSVTGKASTLPYQHPFPPPPPPGPRQRPLAPHILADPPPYIGTPLPSSSSGIWSWAWAFWVGQGKWITKIGENFGENHHHHLCPQWVIGGVLLAPFILPMNGGEHRRRFSTFLEGGGGGGGGLCLSHS